jgi:hypothetical protein
VATRPTITVDADPQALQAAIKALEAYERAAASHHKAVESAAAARDAAVAEAEAAYAQAVEAAEAELTAAKEAAAAAGVNFNDTKARPRASTSAGGGARNRRLTDYDARRALPKGDFTVREYAEALGRDAQTAGNWLRRMVEVGAVKESGSRAGQGPGRAAKLYTKA